MNPPAHRHDPVQTAAETVAKEVGRLMRTLPLSPSQQIGIVLSGALSGSRLPWYEGVQAVAAALEDISREAMNCPDRVCIQFLHPESGLLLHCYRNGTSMLAQPEFELPPHPSKQEIPS